MGKVLWFLCTWIHQNGKYQDKESKAEIVFENGKFKEIIIKDVPGKAPLDVQNLKKIKKVIELYRDDIVRKWIDFFVYNIEFPSEKITKKYETMVISIDKAEYIGDYKIKFSFSDSVERLIDFSGFLKNAKNPMTKKYLDKKLFKEYSIEYGDIIWNDYEMCFPIWDLHERKI